jgi:hypothetical protein
MDGDEGNWRRLAAAVLLRAAQDAQGDDPTQVAPARAWLQGQGAELARALDLEPSRVRGWLAELSPELQPLLF